MTLYYIVYDASDLGRALWSGEVADVSDWDGLVASVAPHSAVKVEEVDPDKSIISDDYYIDVATKELRAKIHSFPIIVPPDMKVGVVYRIPNIPINTFILFPDGHGEIDTDGFIEFEFDVAGLYYLTLDHPHYHNQEVMLDVEA